MDFLTIPQAELQAPAKQRRPEQRDQEREPNPERERAYVLAALDSEAAALKSVKEGNRHLALRDAAYALGGYVRPGLLESHEVEDALYKAATANGLVDDDGEAKVRDVLERALAAGAEAPRELPPEPAKGTITFTTNSEPKDLPDTEDWPEIEPLPEQLPAVPTLPPEMLPDSLRPWLKDVAERQNTPLEMPAAAAVVALGATIGRGLGIYPKKHDDDWLVIPNLFGGVCGPPGIMKSAAISEATKPLRRIEAEAWEQFDQDQAANEALKERLRLELEELKRQMKDALKKGDTNRVDAIQADLSDKTAELNSAETTARRYATQDATVEKLGELLQENQRGLLVLRDELAGWLRTLERPGREGDREFYLEAWNGTGGYTFDRIGRGTVRIPAVCLSILGGIQPGKLRRYIHEALDGGSGADGLLQRLQVVVWPEHLGEWRNVDRYPDRAAAERAYLIFKRLSKLDGAALGLFEGGNQ